MKNLGLSKKLLVCFSVLLVQGLLLAGIGLVGINNMKKEVEEINTHSLAAADAMGDIREAFQKERVLFMEMFIYIDNPAKINNLIESVNQAHLQGDAAVNRYVAAVEDMSRETEFMEAGALLEPGTGKYYLAKEKIMEAARNGNPADVLGGINAAAMYVETIEKDFAAATKNHLAAEAERLAAIDSMFSLFTIAMIVILAAGVGLVAVLWRYLHRRLTKPLVAFTNFMNKASSTGDLTIEKVDVETISSFAGVRDELGVCIGAASKFIQRIQEITAELEKLADGDMTVETVLLSEKDTMGLSLEKMVVQLNEMFAEIKAASVQVTLGANQVASGSQSLAQGATEQASSISELSNSISEISNTTKQNAKMADEAASLSLLIKSNAEKGSQQMDKLMAAVTDISHASKSINKVIKVIDDIAFQTNILALNAAVEAARAGQHGKGFAVVADEVRSLAAKSAESAKDTNALIESSIEKANLGLATASDTLASLKEIVEGINHSTETIALIAQASDTQAASISHVNVGIEQVAKVVQQNSATAEESAATSEEMSGQASLLLEHVRRFRLKDEYADNTDNMPVKSISVVKRAPYGSEDDKYGLKEVG